jgi:hypothetical protein
MRQEPAAEQEPTPPPYLGPSIGPARSGLLRAHEAFSPWASRELRDRSTREQYEAGTWEPSSSGSIVDSARNFAFGAYNRMLLPEAAAFGGHGVSTLHSLGQGRDIAAILEDSGIDTGVNRESIEYGLYSPPGLSLQDAMFAGIPAGSGQGNAAIGGLLTDFGRWVINQGRRVLGPLGRLARRGWDAVRVRVGAVARHRAFYNLPRTRNPAERMFLRIDGINPLREGRLRRELAKSQIGRKILEAADADIIHLDVSSDRVDPTLFGEAIGNTGYAYIRSTQSYARTAETLIHEGIHALGVAGSRRAEALARIGEAMHRGEVIDVATMRRILLEIRAVPDYARLPWQTGRTSPHFPGIKF